MSEKNINEKNEKNANEKNKTEKSKKSKTNKEKRFYLITAIGCAVALVAIIVVAAVMSNSNNVQGMRDPVESSEIVDSNHSSPEDSSNGGAEGENSSDEGGTNKPVGGESEGMAMPVATVAVGNDYGFYHNKTLNNYYEHTGIDFTAEAGTEVFAVEAGVVESIYKDDLLLGTQIVVAHENGVKSVYCFVTEKEGLKVGDSVAKGDVIATVAEPTGNEYKDGAHLHFEMTVDGKNVDPAVYLTLEEK